MKTLPHGHWVGIHSLDPQTTEQELQDLIVERTGVLVALERISVKERDASNSGAIVSMTAEDLRDIFRWIFTDDTLHGRPIQLTAPAPKKKAA